MYEICVLSVHVEKVFEHAEDKSWYGENLGEGFETELTRQGYKEGNC